MKKLIPLAFVFSCGEDKHKINVPPSPPPAVTVETETPQVTIEPQSITIPTTDVSFSTNFQEQVDPPGIDNIKFGKMKCDFRKTPTNESTMICIYGLVIEDAEGKDHTQYYSCLVTPNGNTCTPIKITKDSK